jgi:hypothetical protein
MPYTRIGKVRGFSPSITVYKDEDEEYVLAVQNEASQFLTPNLCGFSPKISVKTQGDNTYILEIETSEETIETPNLSGFAPTVEVYENSSSAYRLKITTASGFFITPNLRDVKYRIGDFYIQYPDTPVPLEADPPLPGTWDIWSHRAVMYGVTQPALPSFADYYDLVGTTITAGATPVVCYHRAGDDFRLYQLIAQTAAYTVPAELDPVKWTYLQPGVISERQKCGNLLTEDDYEIGDTIISGAYAGMYISEVIVPGGKFWGVEGGFRPTFVSGGVQGDRIREMEGTAGSEGRMGASAFATGVFTASVQSAPSAGDNAGGMYTLNNFKASRVVPTGPDNAPASTSVRFWRRTE